MNKILNVPENFVSETLEGILLATSMEMAGMSISIFKLDEELEGLLADEAITPFYTNVNK